jgi:hypothetical protein
MHELWPTIEVDVPIPSRARQALPTMSAQEELTARVSTIKLLSDLQGHPITPDDKDKYEAEVLAKQMMADPELRPEYSKYKNEVMAYLAGMVAQSNVQLVDELSELKMYVVNKLIYEVEHAKDSKSRITALSKLGEVDGVDAFKKRTETTVTIKPMEEVERELLNVLNNIEYTVLPNTKYIPDNTQYLSDAIEEPTEEPIEETYQEDDENLGAEN